MKDKFPKDLKIKNCDALSFLQICSLLWWQSWLELRGTAAIAPALRCHQNGNPTPRIHFKQTRQARHLEQLYQQPVTNHYTHLQSYSFCRQSRPTSNLTRSGVGSTNYLSLGSLWKTAQEKNNHCEPPRNHLEEQALETSSLPPPGKWVGGRSHLLQYILPPINIVWTDSAVNS